MCPACRAAAAHHHPPSHEPDRHAPLVQGAVDFRADPTLYEACKEDSANLCKDVKNGGGRIQACLVSSARS
jgi:hypothetical protein